MKIKDFSRGTFGIDLIFLKFGKLRDGVQSSWPVVKYGLGSMLLLAMVFLGATEGHAQSASVILPSMSVPEGLNVTVAMSISGIPGAGLSDFQGRLNFDPSVIQISRVTGLNGYTVFASQLDNQGGEVRFVVAKTSTPFLQDGEVLEFAFTPIGSINSSSTLTAALTTFNDSNGVFIPHTVNNGRLTIVTRQDLVAAFGFAPQRPIINEEVRFTDETVPSQGAEIEAWSWNFGDGTTSAERNPAHVFTQPGTFTVEMTVTDNFRRSNTTAKQVTVLEAAPSEEGSVITHAFPQPATTEATFVYQIPQSTNRAMLHVFSAKGRQVYQNNALNVNSTRFTWNLIGNDEQAIPNGAYFYVIVALGDNGQSIGRGNGKLIVQR
jgi:PKD repeat protein